MRVQVVKEVSTGDAKKTNKWELCFQWCNYIFDDGSLEQGYRFIWRKPGGALQPARGQARLPSIEQATSLMNDAKKEGWGERVG